MSTSREANSWVRAVVEFVAVAVVLVLPCPPSKVEKRKGRTEAAYTPKGGERGALPWEESTLIAAADQVMALVVVVVAVSTEVGADERGAVAFAEGTFSPSLGVDAVAFVALVRRRAVSRELVALEGLIVLLLPNTLSALSVELEPPPALTPEGMGLVALLMAVAFEAVVELLSFPPLLVAASKRRRFPLFIGMGAGEVGLQ